MANSTSLITDSTSLITDPTTLITPIPIGSTTTLTWVGGGDFDPTDPANWSPQQAPVMAADQSLVMHNGVMAIETGNLAAHQLNVDTGPDTAFVELAPPGSVDLNVAQGATANVDLGLYGPGSSTTNITTYMGPLITDDPSSHSDLNCSIAINDGSMLNLQANMAFGQLTVQGGETDFQGDSHLNGVDVTLDTKLGGFGSIELASVGSTPARMEIKSSDLPVGLNLSVDDNNGLGAPNGVTLDHTSTTPGGTISLTDAFAEIGKQASSYTLINGELDLYDNGTKFAALNIQGAALSVGVADNHTFIYNCSPDALPIGGAVHASSPFDTSFTVNPNSVLGPIITPLPMHA